jgi:hypothetical protein
MSSFIAKKLDIMGHQKCLPWACGMEVMVWTIRGYMGITNGRITTQREELSPCP